MALRTPDAGTASVFQLGPRLSTTTLCRKTLASHRQLQFDVIVRSEHQILLGSQISFGGLDRCMAQEQLDLLQFPTGYSAQLSASAASMPHAA
jgi:hypothetical protein